MTGHDVSLILDAIAGVRDDVAEVKGEVRDVKREAEATNGRLRKLELWRHGLEAVEQANSWIRPALVGLISGGALTVLAFLINR